MSNCYIDIVDTCNLRCATCVRGTHLFAHSAKSMSINLFTKVIEKAKAEGYVVICLYNWSEPFLAKALPEYIAAVRDQGLWCEVSSNLSLQPQTYSNIIERSLAAGMGRLIVSVSGYSQAVYEINHAGGNISWVKENLEHISRLRRAGSISTVVSLRLIRFDYNAKEQDVLKEYADSLGLDFEALDGAGHPDHPIASYCSEEYLLNRLKKFNPARRFEKTGELCPLIMETISIDTEGDVYICCGNTNYPFLRIGAYLELPKDDILLKRYTHPICPSCTFPRRKATASDCKALVDALKSRLDNPGTERTAEGNPHGSVIKEIVANVFREGHRWLS